MRSLQKSTEDEEVSSPKVLLDRNREEYKVALGYNLTDEHIGLEVSVVMHLNLNRMKFVEKKNRTTIPTVCLGFDIRKLRMFDPA